MKDYLNFKVIVSKDEDGIYVVSCPAIPGCHSQGDTLEEAEANIREAIALCLKVAEENQEYRSSIDFRQGKDFGFIGISDVYIARPRFV